MGMKVDEIEMNSDNIEVNISDYERGIYFFNVEGEVVKVIKNWKFLYTYQHYQNKRMLMRLYIWR